MIVPKKKLLDKINECGRLENNVVYVTLGAKMWNLLDWVG